MHKSDNDKELWLRLKNGDRHAFEIIYKNEIQDLINYGRRFNKEISVIEDCVHDLFVYIWSKRDSLSETDSIKKYLLVALRHRIINTVTKLNKTSYSEPDENMFESETSIEMDITSNEEQLEKKADLESVYHVLSKRQKEAIFLKFNNEHSYEDICQIMEINYQSARNLISSGLKKLQIELKKIKK